MEDLSDSSSSWISSDESWSSDDYEVLHEREKRKTNTFLKRKQRIKTVPAKRANILRNHKINDTPNKPETDLREKIINSLLVIKCCFDDLFEAVGIENYDFPEQEKDKCVANDLRKDNKESGIGSSDGSDDNMGNGIREIQTENEFNISTSSSSLKSS